MGCDGIYIVVLGDQGVDGAGTQDVVFHNVILGGLFRRPAFVSLFCEDGDVGVDDVVALVLGQSAFVRAIVDVVGVDVDFFVLSFDEFCGVVLDNVEVGFAVVCGTNGGGDREGEDGGEKDEPHVGLGRWFGFGFERWVCSEWIGVCFVMMDANDEQWTKTAFKYFTIVAFPW